MGLFGGVWGLSLGVEICESHVVVVVVVVVVVRSVDSRLKTDWFGRCFFSLLTVVDKRYIRREQFERGQILTYSSPQPRNNSPSKRQIRFRFLSWVSSKRSQPAFCVYHPIPVSSVNHLKKFCRFLLYAL